MLEGESKVARLAMLLAQTKHGDRDSFHLLYKLTSAQLFQTALRNVWSRETAEEILQESYIAIWRDAASFDHARSAPLTWMMTIVRNKSVDWLRANHARNYCTVAWDGTDFDQPGEQELDPCVSAERKQRRQQINLGMNRLDARHREAIELCFFKELSHAEVATKMTLPLGTVKTWIRRGCQQIRHHLEHQPA